MRHTHSLSCMWSESVSDFVWWLASKILSRGQLCRKTLLRLKCKLKLSLSSKKIYTPLPWPRRCLPYRPAHLKLHHWNNSWEFKVLDMFINMRQLLAVLWTLGLLLHFYLLHEFFLLDYETILSNLKLYKLSFRKYNLSKNW